MTRITITTEQEQPKRTNVWELYWFHKTDPDASYPADEETLGKAGYILAAGHVTIEHYESRMRDVRAAAKGEISDVDYDSGALQEVLELADRGKAAEALVEDARKLVDAWRNLARIVGVAYGDEGQEKALKLCADELEALASRSAPTAEPSAEAGAEPDVLWVSGSIVGYNGERWRIVRNVGGGRVLLEAGGVHVEAAASELGEAPEAETCFTRWTSFESDPRLAKAKHLAEVWRTQTIEQTYAVDAIAGMLDVLLDAGWAPVYGGRGFFFLQSPQLQRVCGRICDVMQKAGMARPSNFIAPELPPSPSSSEKGEPPLTRAQVTAIIDARVAELFARIDKLHPNAWGDLPAMVAEAAEAGKA